MTKKQQNMALQVMRLLRDSGANADDQIAAAAAAAMALIYAKIVASNREHFVK